MLAGISSRAPALLEAHKLSSRAARVGFDWPEIEGLFEKLAEETAELREELNSGAAGGISPAGKGVAGSGKPQVSPELHERLEDEVGDLFFVLVNIARYLALDPESGIAQDKSKIQSAVFNGWKSNCAQAAAGPEQASMEELENCGSRPSGRRKRRERERARRRRGDAASWNGFRKRKCVDAPQMRHRLRRCRPALRCIAKCGATPTRI